MASERLPRGSILVLVTALIAAGTSPARVSGHWRIVPSPSPGTFAQLYAVSATSATDAWAVGEYSDRPILTLIEHWNGTSWSVVPSPSPQHGGAGDGLSGVLALSATDAWAVGSQTVGGSDRPLIEHWDGTSWRVLPTPSPGASDDLYDVMTHGSSGQLWAVGASQSTFGGPFAPLVEEWNGSGWKVVPSQDPPEGGYLFGDTSISHDDAWAAGEAGAVNQTLAEHWDGTSWSIVATAPTGPEYHLDAVAASSSADVWAVGGSYAGLGALIEHWDGSAWSVVPSPKRGGAALDAVVAGSVNGVWAVGSYTRGSAYLTLTERWSGTAWSVESSPNAGESSSLHGLAAMPGTNQVWAVGLSTTGGGTAASTLIELFS